VLSYIVLVGSPLLGLLGILRTGRHLTAPTAVRGVWDLEADFAPLASTACGALLATMRQPSLTISQSGTRLLFSIHDPAETGIPGAIQDSALTMGWEGREPGRGSGEICEDPPALYLKATVLHRGGKREMTGILGIDGCEKCLPIHFRAFSQAPSARGDR
jgi:hypothetical protein